LLGLLRSRDSKALRHPAHFLTTAFRNLPSFLFMYYIAFVMPIEFDWQGTLYTIPAWIKACLALTIPVVGFCSDQIYGLSGSRDHKAPNQWMLFAVAWAQYFMIILMASSTAAVIGVDEIVGRANTVIAATDPQYALWVYSYVALWFLLSGHLFNKTIKTTRDYILDKRKHLRLEE